MTLPPFYVKHETLAHGETYVNKGDLRTLPSSEEACCIAQLHASLQSNACMTQTGENQNTEGVQIIKEDIKRENLGQLPTKRKSFTTDIEEAETCTKEVQDTNAAQFAKKEIKTETFLKNTNHPEQSSNGLESLTVSDEAACLSELQAKVESYTGRTDSGEYQDTDEVEFTKEEIKTEQTEPQDEVNGQIQICYSELAKCESASQTKLSRHSNINIYYPSPFTGCKREGNKDLPSLEKYLRHKDNRKPNGSNDSSSEYGAWREAVVAPLWETGGQFCPDKYDQKFKLCNEKCGPASDKSTSEKFKLPSDSHHRCCLCNQDFPTQSAVTRHLKTHLGLEPHATGSLPRLRYFCSVCCQTFGSLHDLTEHTKTVHFDLIPSSSGNEISRSKTPVTGGDTYFCTFDICGDKIDLYCRLNRHSNSKRCKDVLFQCNVCELKFITQSLLDQHKLEHSKDCDLQGFNHGDELSFKCEVCNICFKIKDSSTLERHKVHTHSAGNPYTKSCDECGKGFIVSRTLDQHNLVHSNLALPKLDRVDAPLFPFKCQVCKILFKREEIFKRHLKFYHPRENSIVHPDPFKNFCCAYQGAERGHWKRKD